MFPELSRRPALQIETGGVLQVAALSAVKEPARVKLGPEEVELSPLDVSATTKKPEPFTARSVLDEVWVNCPCCEISCETSACTPPEL